MKDYNDNTYDYLIYNNNLKCNIDCLDFNYKYKYKNNIYNNINSEYNDIEINFIINYNIENK